MNFDWNRWPLLAAALLGIGIGVGLLHGSDQPGAKEFAGFILIVGGFTAFGAFIESRK